MNYRSIFVLGSIMSFTSAVKAQGLQKGENTTPVYGNNIVSIAPVLINNTGAGMGFSYERIFDPKGKFGLYVPFYYTRHKADWHYNDHYKSRCIGGGFGMKFYPGSSRSPWRYALGFLIPYESLTRSIDSSQSPGGRSGQDREEHFSRGGILFHNSLTVTLAQHFVLSMEANLGIWVGDQIDFETSSPYALLMLKFGYRF